MRTLFCQSAFLVPGQRPFAHGAIPRLLLCQVLEGLRGVDCCLHARGSALGPVCYGIGLGGPGHSCQLTGQRWGEREVAARHVFMGTTVGEDSPGSRSKWNLERENQGPVPRTENTKGKCFFLCCSSSFLSCFF